MGRAWEDDTLSFSDVTIAMCRLHQTFRALTYSDSLGQAGAPAGRALFATACADQHIFGVLIVSEFFRRAGWHVWNEPGATIEQLEHVVARERYDVIGLSAACGIFVEDIANEIEKLRRASKNRKVRIMVGGNLFLEQPELVAQVGADGFARDAREATEIARRPSVENR